MAESRVFSIEEVDALVPELSRRVAVLMGVATEVNAGIQRLHALSSARPRSLIELPDDSPEVRSLKTDLRQRMDRWESGWKEVSELGAVVKDASTGLLDFLGRIDGRQVWLCWRYGESRLDWYHEIDAGFSGRRPLAEVRARALN